MKQQLLHQLPFFSTFDFRNKVINENCTKLKDITELPPKIHYQTAMSYLTEKQIFVGINKRLGKVFYSKARANFTVSNSVDAFKKNQVTTRYGLLRQINNWIKKDYRSAVLNCGLNLFDPAFVGALTKASVFSGDANLKAYWKFNEASGDIINVSESAVDLGAAADIQITGATYSQTGIIGNALLFDGINDFGVVGTSKSQFNYHIGQTKATTAFWYKSNNAPSSREQMMSSVVGGGDKGFLIDFNANRVMNVVGQVSAGELYLILSSNDFVPDDNFNFYVVTWDESAGSNNIKQKVNNGGLEQANKNRAGEAVDATNALNIARRPSNEFFVDGLLDEISDWNKVMSDDDQTALYNGGSGLEIY